MIWKEGLEDDEEEGKEGSVDDPLKAKKLIAEVNFEYPDCGLVTEITLVGGALERAYGDEPLDDDGRPNPSH